MVDQKLSIIHRAGKENIVQMLCHVVLMANHLLKELERMEVQVAVVSSSTADVSLLSLVPQDDPICVIGVTHRTEKDPLLRLLINYYRKESFQKISNNLE